MNAVISVIVPVYNVAAYLPECVDSILGQSYRDLEVILIDDGSSDHSGAICDGYAAKDPRVLVIHQKNGGAAAAKNAGLRVATGKYLSFVDSDDYLEPDAYSYMVGILRQHDADVVQCAFRDVFQNTTADHISVEGTEGYSAMEYLERYTKDWTCGLLWDKLYVRSLFHGIWFEEGHRIDDEYFTYRGIMNARRVLRNDRIIYNYRKRRSSVMYAPESGKKILMDRIDYLSKRRVNVIARFPELRRVFDRHFAEMMVILSRDAWATMESNALIKQQLRAYLKEKAHTPVDIRLWPALVQLWCGLVKKTAPDEEKMSHTQYFD